MLGLLVVAVAYGAEVPFGDVVLPGKNYVNNGGFERGSEGWEAFAGRTSGGVVNDEHHSGGACYKATGVIDDYRYLNQTPVPLTPGRIYTLSAWMKTAGFRRAGKDAQALNLTNYGWTQSAQLSPLQSDQDWTRYEVTFEAPPTSEQGGRPSYTLVVFWPTKSEGTVWIDDIQIEEGAKATEFADSYVGWGMQALATVRRARVEAEGLRKNLTEGEIRAPVALAQRITEAITATDGVAGQLRQYAGLSVEAARTLLADTEKLSGDISALSTMVFPAHPYLPLNEVALPSEQPSLSWDMTCLQGEHRAMALTVANLGTRGETARLVASELYDETRGVRLTGVPWLTVYTAPPIRGLARPWQRYTDPLPKLAEGGLWALLPGELNQAVLVCDTNALAPGTYRAQVELQSLTRQAPPRTVAVRLMVAPVRLPALSGIAVCDIGLMADYALDSIAPLQVNTFSVPAQWLVPEVTESAMDRAATVDFARLAPLVKARLARCPTGSFWLGFGVGHIAAEHLQKVLGVGLDDAKFKQAFSQWVKAVVRGFGELGVPPERLVFETVDEPGSGQLAEATLIAQAIEAAEPRVLTQTYVTSVDTADKAAMQMYEAHDIIAPGCSCLNAQTMEALRRLGKQVWVYDCQNNAETFHPVTYYRLLPWVARRWGLTGWGHFSMLNSERGRNYVPWQGVAEESLVYPDGEGQVISRRWLALQAGTEDYRALESLARLLKALGPGGVPAPALQARAEKLLAEAPTQALALAKPGREYFTGLQPGADAALLDRVREEAATLAGELAAAMPMRATVALAAEAGKTMVRTNTPTAADVTVRYLCDHALPWHELTAAVKPGQDGVAVPAQNLSRCQVQLVSPAGPVYTEYTPPVPRISVDSTIEPYSPERLNDGIAMPGMKFEPEYGWISGGAATEHWVEARLDQVRPVRGVKVWWMTFYGLPQAVKLQVWRDGAWADAPGYEQWRAAKVSVEELTMPAVTTDRVRVVQKAGGGNKAFANLMGMSEIEVLTGK